MRMLLSCQTLSMCWPFTCVHALCRYNTTKVDPGTTSFGESFFAIGFGELCVRNGTLQRLLTQTVQLNR